MTETGDDRIIGLGEADHAHSGTDAESKTQAEQLKESARHTIYTETDERKLRSDISRLTEETDKTLFSTQSATGRAESPLEQRLRDAETNYRTKGERELLKNVEGDVKRGLVKILYKIGLMTPLSELKRETKVIKLAAAEYRSWYEASKRDLEEAVKRQTDFEIALGKVYETDDAIKNLLAMQDKKQATLLRRSKEIRASGMLDTEREKELAKNEKELRLSKNYAEDLRMKRHENLIKEKTLTRNIEEQAGECKAFDAEARDYCTIWYQLTDQSIPVTDKYQRIVERKQQAVSRLPFLGERVKKANRFREIIEESNAQKRAIALSGIDYLFPERTVMRGEDYSSDLADVERESAIKIRNEFKEMELRKARYLGRESSTE